MRTKSFTIGSDPEFIIYTGDGQFVEADTVLSQYGRVGCDGHSSTGELRPDPGENPLEHLEHVADALDELKETLDSELGESCWYVRAGSGVPGDPTGGHIHFGGLDPDPLFLKALDFFLALPLMFIEDERARFRRNKSDYGMLSDWRSQPHGFEYRTPPSWLVSRRHCRAVLSLAWMIATAFVEKRLPRRIPSVPPELFDAQDKAALKHLLPTIWRGWKYMDREGRYLLAMNILWEQIKLGQTWREDWPINFRWPVLKESEPGRVLWLEGGYKLKEIAEKLTELLPRETARLVYIYGLSESRGIDIASSWPKVNHLPVDASNIITRGPLAGLRVSFSDYGMGQRAHRPIRIGLSRNVRHDPDRAARIVETFIGLVQAARELEAKEKAAQIEIPF